MHLHLDWPMHIKLKNPGFNLGMPNGWVGENTNLVISQDCACHKLSLNFMMVHL